jgi:hypothetical protein
MSLRSLRANRRAAMGGHAGPSIRNAGLPGSRKRQGQHHPRAAPPATASPMWRRGLRPRGLLRIAVAPFAAATAGVAACESSLPISAAGHSQPLPPPELFDASGRKLPARLLQVQTVFRHGARTPVEDDGCHDDGLCTWTPADCDKTARLAEWPPVRLYQFGDGDPLVVPQRLAPFAASLAEVPRSSLCEHRIRPYCLGQAGANCVSLRGVEPSPCCRPPPCSRALLRGDRSRPCGGRWRGTRRPPHAGRAAAGRGFGGGVACSLCG